MKFPSPFKKLAEFTEPFGISPMTAFGLIIIVFAILMLIVGNFS